MDVEHAEQALRRSEEWFRAAFDQAAVGVAHTSPDGRWLRVNQRLCDLLGYTREELGRRTFQDLTHPDDLPADLAYTRLLLDGEIRTYSMEKRYVRRDGSHVWVDLTVSLTREPSGQPDCFIAVVVDITDRKRAEEELRRSEERFRSLVQNASDVVTVIDADGITRYVSPSVERVLGYRPEDRIGASVLESSIIHPDDADTVRTAFAETLRSPDRILTTEFRARHADGSWRDLEAVARNLLDDPGVEGIVVNYRDITERKRAEEALAESEGRFRALFERSPDGILLFDPHDPDVLWRIVDCNEVAARMNGYARGDLIGRSINVLIGGKMCRERAAEYLGRLRTAPVHDRDVHVRRDGTAFPIEYSSSVISVGGRELVLGIDRDITEREHAEEALRRSQASLANTQRIAHLGSWEWNLDRNELAWSDEVYRIFGLTPQEFAATNEAFLDRVHPDDRARVTAAADAALTGGGPYSIDHRIVRPGGEVRFVHEQAEVILAENGRPLRMVGAVHDVTERKVLEERLKHQAFHDPLTGLPNRTLFMDRLEHALARATRRPASVAVLFLDLDRFKFVNDSLGHEAGDQILVALAARLRACLRPQDTIARLSGDEFTILLEDIADTSDAIAVAERVGEALCAPFECGAHEVLVTTTIGIAFSTAGHGTPEDLLRAADVAMYSAKSSGKAQFKIFEVEMGRQALDRLDLEADLRRAIERDEFGVYYQPEVELDTGRIVGMEALVRWERRGGGPMEPEAFIPLAEETGLILPIERLVLRAVCRQARIWRDRYGDAALPVCLNISARHLQHPGLLGEVAACLEEAGLHGWELQLEITESAVMNDAATNTATLADLRGLGVSLAVDDFGTGYSSLSYLKRFPIDVLKIDRAFVEGIGRDSEDTAIIRAIIGLGHALHLRVIAEGVETAEQVEQLRALGCRFGQGYIVAKPLPPAEADALLARSEGVLCEAAAVAAPPGAEGARR